MEAAICAEDAAMCAMDAAICAEDAATCGDDATMGAEGTLMCAKDAAMAAKNGTMAAICRASFEITNYPALILPLSPPLSRTAAVSPDFGAGQCAFF